jgi:hypothetical protein
VEELKMLDHEQRLFELYKIVYAYALDTSGMALNDELLARRVLDAAKMSLAAYNEGCKL